MIGPASNYFILNSYAVRLDNAAFDDTPFKDEFQDEVYAIAKRVAEDQWLNSVIDIGCGSAYKLNKWFRDIESSYVAIGAEVEPTLSKLREEHPMEIWADASLLHTGILQAHMVICSDVIEHVPDPDKILDSIAACKPKVIVISTPALEHLEQGCVDGPPRNIHHVREWTTEQFKAYIGSRFHVLEQVVTEQKNQVIVCRP